MASAVSPRNLRANVFGACVSHASVMSSVSSGTAIVGQPDQDHRVAVEVRRGEVHVGLIGDERELHPFIRDARTEDVAVGCVVAERGEVGLAQRPFPHDELLADPPVSR